MEQVSQAWTLPGGNQPRDTESIKCASLGILSDVAQIAVPAQYEAERQGPEGQAR